MTREAWAVRCLLLGLLCGCNVSQAPTGREAGATPMPHDAGRQQDASAHVLELTDPSVPFPEALSDLGLYAGLDPSRPVKVALNYTPRAELWSNGLTKARVVVLPEAETIDPREEPWRFPVGTLFFKTFSDLDGPVETRVLRNAGESFEYAVYRWQDGEAHLLDGRRNVELEVRAATGGTRHTIPSHLTCAQCHESGDSQVLGFRSLQLWQATVEGAERLFRPSLELRDPLGVEDGREREVLDYFVGNCVHCHNGSTGLASSFDLSPDVAFANVIDRPTEGNGSAPGIRVVPGDPLASVLFRAVSGEGDTSEVKDMPPEGVQERDAAGVELLRRWITGLEPPRR